jgi:RHS repeat-associated protein
MVGGTNHSFASDENGNLAQQDLDKTYVWDHAGRMIGYELHAGTQLSCDARYLYGADGNRVKKWVKTSAAQVESTVYIGTLFEYSSWFELRDSAPKEGNSLHLTNSVTRFAVVQVGDRRNDDAGPSVQFHLADHLGSSVIVVDDSATWINREEYLPYGESSFGSFARKRYRFTGRERDLESSLCYHDARYFSPGCSRWISCDPSGPVDGTNLFKFSANSPVNFNDRTGRGAESTNLGASGEDLFAKVLDELGKTSREQIPFSGGEEVARSDATSIVDFVFEKGAEVIHTVDIKSRDLSNWVRKDGSLNEARIAAKETEELANTLKHMGDTQTKETMLYLLKNATPEQASQYAEIVAKVHQQSTAALKPGLGVTTFERLTRITEEHFSGVFKRSSGVMQRMPRLKSPKGFVTLEGAGDLLGVAGVVMMALDVQNTAAETYKHYEARGVGKEMAIAQAGKTAAKEATAWLWFAAGAALALTLASGGGAAPLAAAAIGALVTTYGSLATDELIDLATPELAK